MNTSRKGAFITPNRRRRRNATNRVGAPPMLGPRDIDTQRIAGLPAPPPNVFNPPVTRKVRMEFPYVGTAFSQAINAAVLATQDTTDYSAGGVRFTTLRITKCEAWLGTNSDPTTGSWPHMTLEDVDTQVYFQDTPNGGVDWAHIAMRPCLASRIRIRPITDTVSALRLAVPAAAGATGTVVVDTTVTFQ